MYDLFRVKELLIKRKHDRVRNDVIYKVRPGRTGKSHITCLNGRNAICQYADSSIRRVPLQIDCDVNVQITDQFGSLRIQLGGDVEEPVKGFDQTRSNCAAIVRPERNSDHLEAFSVVKFEELGHDIRGDMPVKVRRQIGDPNSVG